MNFKLLLKMTNIANQRESLLRGSIYEEIYPAILGGGRGWRGGMARLSFHRAIILILLNRDETGLLPFLSVNAADKN